MHQIVGIVRVAVFDNGHGKLSREYKLYYKYDGQVSDIQEHSLDTLVECCIIRQENLAESFGIKCSTVSRQLS